MAASPVCCKVSSTCSPLLATRSKNSITVLGSLSFSPTTHRRIPSLSTGFISPSIKNKRQPCPLRVRSVAAPAKTAAGFDKMVSGTQCKYYLLGGQGGVGKTSCAASLAVKFANSGHATLVVSTDPAHSLSDSFAQDLTGGTLIQVEGPSPLFALEITQRRQEKNSEMFLRRTVELESQL